MDKGELQEEICKALQQLKHDLEINIPQYVIEACRECEVDKIGVQKQQSLVRSLQGMKMSMSADVFSQRFPELVLRHLIRVRKNTLQTIPGLNSGRPKSISELFQCTFFMFQDSTIDQYPILQRITMDLNRSVECFYVEQKEGLKEIKEKEKVLLNQLSQGLKIQPLHQQLKAITKNDFGKCLCSVNKALQLSLANALNSSPILRCHLCQMCYHSVCLKVKPDLSLYLCPMCTIEQLDPLHRVIEVVSGAQYYEFSSLNNCKTMVFELSERLRNYQVEIRCLRIDGKGGLDEITWPDYGELILNGQKVVDLSPLQQNTSLKKRKDEKFCTKSRLLYNQVNRFQLKELKPSDEQKKVYRISYGQTYVVAVFAVEILTAEQLISQVKQDEKHYQSVEMSKQMIIESEQQQGDVRLYTKKISLLCQFSLSQMRIPARGNLCSHSQCFDLQSLVKIMAQQKTTRKWRCPVCKIKCYNFIIDSYQLQICTTLQQHNIKDINDIVFQTNGDVDNQYVRELMLKTAIKRPSNNIDQIPGAQPTKKVLIEHKGKHNAPIEID